MFEFERDPIIKTTSKKLDDYDLELGMAISNSLLKTPGSQIRDPYEIKKIVDEKIKEFIEKEKDTLP